MIMFDLLNTDVFWIFSFKMLKCYKKLDSFSLSLSLLYTLSLHNFSLSFVLKKSSEYDKFHGQYV